ncbi:hypothetical protein PC120_g3837 [Phytophthora cactorum]|nr:hypothetical protein PC120_g3837 [Phytophthora cactorum]
MLRRFRADCLRRQRARPRFQLLLDQCMVEYALASQDLGLSLSGSMIIAQAKKNLIRLNVPPASWPRLGWARLRNLQDRYGMRWSRAHGEDDLVNLEPVQDEVKSLCNLIRTYPCTDVYNMDERESSSITCPVALFASMRRLL